MASAAARCKLPQASAALALACLALAFAPPVLTDALAYERQAILSGQFWRLWTGHLVHFSLRHALADGSVLFLLGLVVEPLAGTRRLCVALAGGAALISAALLLCVPGLQQYRGASGLDMMMAAMALVLLWRNGGIARPWLVFFAALLVLKIAGEALGISSGFAALPGDIVIVWQAHLLGVLYGFLKMNPLKRRTLAVIAAGALALFSHGASLAAATAFVHVNVVPLDAERILPGQTVIVDQGRITGIGFDLAVPPGAVVIDGHGAYLSPGLADMHTHSDTRADMSVYLAHGVTSVLNMGEAAHGFVGRTKPAANRGEIPSPHIYTAFRLDGSPRYGSFVVATPEEARMAMRLAKANGNDFIKVYNDLSAECFDALIEEGKLLGVPVVGHGIERVGLRRQLAAGQLMVAHAEEFFYTVFKSEGNQAPDDGQIPEVLEMVKRSHAFVTADLVTYATIARQWGKPPVVEGFLRASEARYVSPQDRVAWQQGGYTERKGSLDERLAFLGRFVKAMSDAGVPLITGTDAPGIPGGVPGVSLHDDLDLLLKAGLTPYQALVAASRTPGEMMLRAFPGTAPFDTVTVGARADLILSETNPLSSPATLRHPLGVMAGGKWYSQAQLKELLDKVVKRYQDAAYTDSPPTH